MITSHAVVDNELFQGLLFEDAQPKFLGVAMDLLHVQMSEEINGLLADHLPWHKNGETCCIAN